MVVSFLRCTNRPDHCFDILAHDQFTDSVVHTYVYSLVQVKLYPFTLFTNILLLNRVSDFINKVDASLFNSIHITDTLEYCNINTVLNRVLFALDHTNTKQAIEC